MRDEQRYYPCDYGECPYDDADSGYDCRNYCGLGVDEDEEYVPSAENGDYGPSNPWDAPRHENK